MNAKPTLTTSSERKPSRKAPETDLSPNLGIHKSDRVHVFIDALNLMGMLRSMNRRLDYKLFIAFLKEETRLVRAHYFALLREDMPDSRATGVIDMIEYSGFDVMRKYGREVHEREGAYRFRGTIVPEMTVAMIDAAENGADHLIVISGDGEFFAGIQAAKARGVRITLLSQESSTSDDIRRECDAFIDIESLPDSLFY